MGDRNLQDLSNGQKRLTLGAWTSGARKLLLSFALPLFLVAQSQSSTLAQEQAASPDSAETGELTTEQREARTHFAEGVRAAQEQRWSDAAQAFRRSYRLEPRVEALCNMAITYDRWEGHEEDALRAYRSCAAADESGRFAEHAAERSAAIERELLLAEPEPEPVDAPEPAAEPAVPTPVETRPNRALLVGGIASAIVGVGLAAGGAASAISSNNTLDDLRQAHPDGNIVVGSPAAERFATAESQADRARGLYIGAAVAGVASATMLVLAYVFQSEEQPAQLSVVPSRDGLFAALCVDLN